MTHAELKNAILTAIGARIDVLCWNNAVGVGRIGPRRPANGLESIIKYGAGTGSADILGIQQRQPWACPFAIECKIGRDSQREDQHLWQLQWEMRGGLYIIARDVAAVLEVLDSGEL